MLTPSDVQRFMDVRGIAGEMLHLETPTPTVETAALAVNTSPQQIIKSILFLVNEDKVLAITCGTEVVDRRSIAKVYEVGRKRVKLAPPEVVLEIAGYPVGAMPPFAHNEPIPTLIDPRVLEQPYVYGGGGAENALVRLLPDDILKATQAQIVDLTAAG